MKGAAELPKIWLMSVTLDGCVQLWFYIAI
jgi:hypothetical protein